jgi:choline-sulfatase
MPIRPFSGTVRTLSIVVMLTAAASCRRSDAVPEQAALRPNVLLITIDTLRADRVGATGGPPGVTPAIDELGRAGAVFLDATAHAPLTLPSHASILTGRYPTAHGIHDNGGFTLADSLPTIASLLRGGGYHTAAFVSSFVLRRATGLAHGFDRYDDRFEGAGRAHVTTASLERRAAEVARDAAGWLKDAPRPFFLWVHFYDPHAPYDPPPVFAARFPGRPYDGEVATADFGVATLLASLQPDRRRDTAVIVTGDHGESLGEHGESEHGILLYDATLHVPLVLEGAGIPAGATIPRQVRHVDLLPTIADLTGVKPPGSLDGVSLMPLLRGQTRVGVVADTSRTLVAGPDAPASYAESRFGALHFGWRPTRSLRDGEWKYIEGGSPELYHLAQDRGEREDLSRTRPDTVAGMAGVLASVIGRAETDAAEKPVADADAAARLRSLGYVSGRVELGRAGQKGQDDADPKHEIARYESYVKAFNTGLAALEAGRSADAELVFRRLAREFPLAFEAHQYLARALAVRRATADAVAELDRAIQLSPREPILYFDAARTLADEGQFDRAFARIAAGRRLEPASFYGPLTEGLVARAAGQTERAERAFRDAVQMNPTLAVAHFELGQLAEARGDRDAARREYQLAVDGDASLDAARRGLERLSR